VRGGSDCPRRQLSSLAYMSPAKKASQTKTSLINPQRAAAGAHLQPCLPRRDRRLLRVRHSRSGATIASTLSRGFSSACASLPSSSPSSRSAVALYFSETVLLMSAYSRGQHRAGDVGETAGERERHQVLERRRQHLRERRRNAHPAGGRARGLHHLRPRAR
jgi:hypothetical protein